MTDNTKPTIGEIRDVSDLPLIVYPTTGTTTRITFEAEKTCRTCRHWQPQRNDGAWGDCYELTSTRGHNYIYVQLGTLESADTHRDFSCKLHQPRPDADARE